MKPTFIGIGGQKCATTWLSEVLRYHPEVYMSDVKEILYFTKNYEKGIEWYEQKFKGAKKEKQIGEFSTHYLYDTSVPKRIYKDVGIVKIIAVIRNPIERFISHYMYEYRRGIVRFKYPLNLNIEKFDEILEENGELIKNGYYYEGLNEYINVFGPENVLVLTKDEIDRNPTGVAKKTFEFLNVDENIIPTVTDKHVSKGIIPRSLFLEKVRIKIFKYCRLYAPKLINIIKKYRIAEFFRYINQKKVEIHFDSDVNLKISQLYLSDIKKTELLINVNLEKWYK